MSPVRPSCFLWIEMRMRTVTYKNGGKFTNLDKYPEGLIFDLLAEGIVRGEW